MVTPISRPRRALVARRRARRIAATSQRGERGSASTGTPGLVGRTCLYRSLVAFVWDTAPDLPLKDNNRR